MCMYIHCTVYMCIQANIPVHTHNVCSAAGLLVPTCNVTSASDSHDCTYVDSVVQELLLGGACTKVYIWVLRRLHD